MFEHFAEDYSIIMGLVDLIPVILFAISGSVLIKVLFNELKKPFAVLLCSGVTLSLTAGVFKALWKILLALNVCDFYPLNFMFMPTQALGLTLMGVGLVSLMFTAKKNVTPVMSIALIPALLVILADPATIYDGNIIFIVLLVLGDIAIATSLSFLAIKNRNWLCLALFIVYCIGLIVMGAMKPLSTKLSLDVTTANWVEEAINTVAQAALLVGCFLMNKKGFFKYREETK